MEREWDLVGGIVWEEGASLGRVIESRDRDGGLEGSWKMVVEWRGDVDGARLGSWPESIETSHSERR